MEVRVLTSSADLGRYGAWVKSHPEGGLWQSLEWKTYQESVGREVRIYATMENGQIVASALVVVDRTSFGWSTWEVPRGPLLSGTWKVESGKLIETIIDDVKRERGISLYVSPPTTSLSTFNFQLSTRLVHPEATRVINLTLSDDELLGQMKPKGRYNIGLAQKHGVIVTVTPSSLPSGERTEGRVVESSEIPAYEALARATASRDGFRGPRRGYGRFLRDMPGSFLLLAYAPEKNPREPIAGLLGVTWGKTGIYYYGASSNECRELMAPYLLQWEAMKLCKARGCTSYDLFGIAPEGAVDHPWSGVSDFKAKFGGTVVTYPPEQEITLRPMAKSLLKWKRRVIG